jgi:hypothetical protein
LIIGYRYHLQLGTGTTDLSERLDDIRARNAAHHADAGLTKDERKAAIANEWSPNNALLLVTIEPTDVAFETSAAAPGPRSEGCVSGIREGAGCGAIRLPPN